MAIVTDLINLLLFPAGLGLIGAGLLFQWVDRKLLARFQNRIGPRWFQPFADALKLLGKEEIKPQGANPILFAALPILALAGALTAALYVPLFGFAPAFSFPGDLIVTLYLLSLLTLCIGLAGAQTRDRFSLTGALRDPGPMQLYAVYTNRSILFGDEQDKRVATEAHEASLQGLADERMLAGMVAVYDTLALAWQALAETAAGIPGAGRAN